MSTVKFRLFFGWFINSKYIYYIVYSIFCMCSNDEPNIQRMRIEHISLMLWKKVPMEKNNTQNTSMTAVIMIAMIKWDKIPIFLWTPFRMYIYWKCITNRTVNPLYYLGRCTWISQSPFYFDNNPKRNNQCMRSIYLWDH